MLLLRQGSSTKQNKRPSKPNSCIFYWMLSKINWLTWLSLIIQPKHESKAQIHLLIITKCRIDVSSYVRHYSGRLNDDWWFTDVGWRGAFACCLQLCVKTFSPCCMSFISRWRLEIKMPTAWERLLSNILIIWRDRKVNTLHLSSVLEFTENKVFVS